MIFCTVFTVLWFEPDAPLLIIHQYYCKEKLGAGHSLGFLKRAS